MKIYVMRHGQTEWNIRKVIQGSADIPLNTAGREQAKLVCEKMREKPFDLILTSPLQRAQETAAIVNGEGYSKPIIIEPKLRERNCGEYEGVKKADFDYNDFWNFNTPSNYEKAESKQDFYDRIKLLLDELTVKYGDKTILISTHAGVCRVIKYILSGDRFNNGELGPYLPKNSDILEFEI